MEFELKPLLVEAVPEALKKAERYRLLSEPDEADSICRDILRVDPDNQQALIMLTLALTDSFDRRARPREAWDLVRRFKDEYNRAYYMGIIHERLARAEVRQGAPGSGENAYEDFRRAMEYYERAESLRPPGNDDTILRWNSCARTLMKDHSLRPRQEEAIEPILNE